MKFTIWLLVMVSLGLLLAALVVRQRRMPEGMFYGTWVDRKIPINFLRIREDGTFTMLTGPVPIHTRKCRLVDNEISFRAWEIVVAEGRVEDNRLIFRLDLGGPHAHAYVERIYVKWWRLW